MRHHRLAQRALIESCQRIFMPSRSLPSISAARSPEEWQAVVELARMLGMASILYDAVEATPTRIPDESLRRLRNASRAEAIRHELVVVPTIDATLRTLSQAGLSPIVIKGASIAYTAYPDPVLRTFSDVDILLRQDEAARAWGALSDAGFTRYELDPPAEHHLPALVSPVGRLCVEVHHRLLEEPSSFSSDLETLVARSSHAMLGNAKATILSPEDELILTCLHMSFAHHLRRNVLRGLVDLLGITTVHRYTIDWSYVVRVARDARVAGAIYWPLEAARELLDAPVPDEVMDAVVSSSSLRWLLKASADPEQVAGADMRRFHSPLRQMAILGSLHVGRSPREFVSAAITGAGSALHLSRERRLRDADSV